MNLLNINYVQSFHWVMKYTVFENSQKCRIKSPKNSAADKMRLFILFLNTVVSLNLASSICVASFLLILPNWRDFIDKWHGCQNNLGDLISICWKAFIQNKYTQQEDSLEFHTIWPHAANANFLHLWWINGCSKV